MMTLSKDSHFDITYINIFCIDNRYAFMQVHEVRLDFNASFPYCLIETVLPDYLFFTKEQSKKQQQQQHSS